MYKIILQYFVYKANTSVLNVPESFYNVIIFYQEHHFRSEKNLKKSRSDVRQFKNHLYVIL